MSTEDVARVADTFHAWRGEPGAGKYVCQPGFCSSATNAEVAEHQYVLTPGRLVGAEDKETGGEPLANKIARLTQELENSFAESERTQARVRKVIGHLG